MREGSGRRRPLSCFIIEMKDQLAAIPVVFVLVVGAAGACSGGQQDVASPAAEDFVSQRSIEDVLRAHTEHLMGIDGVVSVGQALCDGEACIRVGVRVPANTLRDEIPDSLGGYPVEVAEIGIVRPLDSDS